LIFHFYAEDVAVENIEKVGELISSQEDQPVTSSSTRKIAAKLNIHHFSIQQIAEHDLRLHFAVSEHRSFRTQS